MLSENQRIYFKDSKVRDNQGNLLKVYHGTGTKIEAFDPMYTGQGADQYGSGFYFTTERSFAEAYTTLRDHLPNGQERTKLGGEDNPNVIEAYINLKNPIIIEDGTAETDLSNILIPNKYVLEIVKKLPTLYHSMDDEIEPNPLADYLEEFWEINPRTQEEFELLIKDMVDTYFQDTDLQKLDILFGKYASELRKAIYNTMSYDGVIINFKDNKHIVAWFPEQIKDVHNLAPKRSPYLMDDTKHVLLKSNEMSIKDRIDKAKTKQENSYTLGKKMKSQDILK